jgi:adenosine deaminase
LEEAPDLKRAIIERNIGIEMCPYANYQIKGFAPMKNDQKEPLNEYPLLKYLRAGVKASVNTDNIGISQAGLTDNFLFLTELCLGITRLEVLQLIKNGLDTAFITFEERQALLDQMEDLILKATLSQSKF